MPRKTKIFRRVEVLGKMLLSFAQDYAPYHIRPAIKVAVEVEDAVAVIKLTADRNTIIAPKYGTLDARAQEFGSGDNAEGPRAKRGKILIAPVNADWLVFPGTNEWEGQTIRVKLVRSPGIKRWQGTGYMKPAIHDLKGQIIPTLDPDIREEVDLTIRQYFGGRTK